MKVNVINPTETDIKVSIEGREYFVEAKGTVQVPEADAAHWKTRLHNFLILEEIKEEKKEEVKVEEKEVVEKIVKKAAKNK